MDISLYIAELLQQNSEVSVPGLGTFYRQHSGAYFDKNSQRFMPPAALLALKRTETADNLLAEYISKQKNISVNSATYFIKKFVDHQHDLLNTSGYAGFKSLGTLELSGGKYRFKGLENQVLANDYFGLTPAPEISRPEAVKMLEKSVPVSAAQPLPEIQPQAFKKEDEQLEEEIIEEEPPRRTSSSWMPYAAVIIFLLMSAALAQIFFPELFNFAQKPPAVTRQPQPAPVLPPADSATTAGDSLAKADTIYNALKKEGFEVEKPRDTVEITTKAEPLNTAEPVTYEIIAAAFGKKAEAEQFVKQLRAKGIDARIVENMPGSKSKVSLGSFRDETAARKELIRIQKTNKEAWIARVKTKKNL